MPRGEAYAGICGRTVTGVFRGLGTGASFSLPWLSRRLLRLSTAVVSFSTEALSCFRVASRLGACLLSVASFGACPTARGACQTIPVDRAAPRTRPTERGGRMDVAFQKAGEGKSVTFVAVDSFRPIGNAKPRDWPKSTSFFQAAQFDVEYLSRGVGSPSRCFG